MPTERADLERGGLRLARWTLMQVIIIVVAILTSGTSGYAELAVDGSRDQVLVRADKAMLSDVIGALGEKFDVHLKSPVPLDTRIDGRFSGTLTSVIRRLLQSYNFVLETGQTSEIDSLVIVVLGRKNNTVVGFSPVMSRPIGGAPRSGARDEGGN